MKIWKNTTLLDSYYNDYDYTDNKNDAKIILLGSQSIKLSEFKLLKAIFRVGIGKDNIPEKEAVNKGIIVRFPSSETINIIYEETADYTCNLIFRMAYNKIGTINPWCREMRVKLSDKRLLACCKKSSSYLLSFS